MLHKVACEEEREVLCLRFFNHKGVFFAAVRLRVGSAGEEEEKCKNVKIEKCKDWTFHIFLLLFDDKFTIAGYTFD
jgi:hypothetical protein